MKRALAIILLAAAGPAVAQTAPVSFTAAQAAHGEQVYTETCASCHGAALDGSQFAPALKTARFRRERGAATAGELFAYVSTNMPPGAGGSLPPEDYAAAIAFVLKQNGASEGAAFPADPRSKAPLALPKAP